MIGIIELLAKVLAAKIPAIIQERLTKQGITCNTDLKMMLILSLDNNC
ncbi:MAG: hypothetical protein MTP17_00385 [Candidatus Midichloria sp.]|nr:MAG: hypothetical protein MTP17_00385 [Candidatus Midichloria sp.]